MIKDQKNYLEEAIASTDKQLSMLEMNRHVNSKLIDSLKRQKLHFMEELAKIEASEKIEKSGPGIFGLLDILDDEEIIKISDYPSNTESQSNRKIT